MRKLYGHSERRAAARPAARRLGQAGGLLPFTTGLALVVIAAGLLGSCATAPASREEKATLVEEARARLQQMQKRTRPWARCSRRATATPSFPMWARRASAWAAPTAGAWCTSGASTSAIAI